MCGGDRNRTYSDIVTRFTVWPGSPTPAHPLFQKSIKTLKKTEPIEGFEPPTR